MPRDVFDNELRKLRTELYFGKRKKKRARTPDELKFKHEVPLVY